jgi:2-deoxy-D-gluconate 3-dehydrogenase
MLLTPRNSRGLKRAKLRLSLVFLATRTNLIGGSARGIGQGVALQLAKAGANIAAFDVLDPSETLELVRKEGVEAKGWQLDASPTNEAGFNKAIDEVEAWHQIDILVNVAGIVRARFVVGRLC